MGPYKSKGDVSENSPGDWDRIFRNANDFLNHPTKEIWKTDTTKECLKRSSPIPIYEGVKLKDAAFVYLITGDEKYLTSVKAILMEQALEPSTDFGDSIRWCPKAIRDVEPGFFVAEWMTKLLFAYDYTKGNYSMNEKKILDDWFNKAAKFFMKDVNSDLNLVFNNRDKGDYSLTSYSKVAKIGEIKSLSHDNGWKIPTLAYWYNNRRGSMIRYVAFAGVFFSNTKYITTSKQYVKEWLRFSVFPDGTVGEFARFEEDFPDLGWAYATYVVSQAMEIADVLARHGDEELYKYKTSKGAFGTEGGNKTILLTIKNLLFYLDKTYTRRAAIHNTNYDPLIDGSLKERNWNTVNDIWFAMGNVYYRNKYIKDNYLRKAKNRDPYPKPEKTATMGPHIPWSGLWAVYPGVLFMFGQMENKVWPYSKEKS
jgi:hypothetical protein